MTVRGHYGMTLNRNISGQALPSRHPDVLQVRIPAKNGDRRQEPVSPHFRGLSSLPVMPDSLDVILSLTQNHGFLRSGSRVGARDDSTGTLRDDSPLTSFWHVPSQNHVLPPSRHAGHRSGIPVLRKSEKSEIPYRSITG